MKECVWTCSLLLFATVEAMLEPGKISEVVNISESRQAIFGFQRSAYNGTEIEIRLGCPPHQDSSDKSYVISLVARSSPCDREYTDMMASQSEPDDVLRMYFSEPRYALPQLEYNYVWYMKPEKSVTFRCSDSANHMPFWTELLEVKWDYDRIIALNVTKDGKRSVVEKLFNRKTREAANKTMGTARQTHPALVVPSHGIYLLVFQISTMGTWTDGDAVVIDIEWRGPHGYLSAVDWPLLPFFGAMCAVYGVFALAWFIISMLQWRELLRIQYWIGGVLMLGMLEAAVFYTEYQTVNTTGQEVEGAIEFAEIVSCLKRTLSRMLIIIVSVGFGVVKPRLGSTLHKVVGVGFLYFVLSSIESIMRVSKVQHASVKQKQLVNLPLTAVEVGICWWIFTSLVNTMRALRLRRNETKLSLYRHFTNTLIFCVLASVVFMAWSLYMHIFTPCLKDWMELWVDTAFWHLLFCVILLVIMILWRPTNNNQRYAFTPLLDNAEDDEDEEEIVYSSGVFTDPNAMKMRGKEGKRKIAEREASIDEDLRWVDENIPTSLADKALPALVDSDEELKATRFEISKMQ